MDDVIDLTQRLISIPSEARPTETYMDIALFVLEEMQTRGIDTRLIVYQPEQDDAEPGWDIEPIEVELPSPRAFEWFTEITSYRPVPVAKVRKYNVIGSMGQGTHHLIVHAHLDTRPLDSNEEWDYPPFEGKIVDGKLHGLGAADNKSGIAIALAALDSIQGMLDRVSVTLAFTADEEVGGYAGAGYMLQKGLLIGDLVFSTNGPIHKINIGCWGRIWVIVSSDDDNQTLFKYLQEHIIELNDIFKKRSIPVRLSHVGWATGGFVNLTFDDQSSSDIEYPVLYKAICDIAPDFTFGMKVMGTMKPIVSQVNQYMGRLSSITGKIFGEERLFQIGAPSDLRFFLRAGMKGVAFGPIRPSSSVHKSDEHVRIDDVETCTKILQEFILQLSRR